MSTPAAQIARTYVAPGTVWDVARNRDHTTGAGALIPQDLGATTDRPGVWLRWTMLAGVPVAHGEVADEAAMLALHTFAMDSADNPSPRYVAPGDSCLRTDDPGWRWHCISGHGQSMSDWERRPLAAALSGLAVSGHTHAISAVTGLQSALDGKAAVTHEHTISAISDATAVGRAMLSIPTPTSGPKLARISTAGGIDLIDVPTGDAVTGTQVDPVGLSHWWPLDDWPSAPHRCLVDQYTPLTPSVAPILDFGPVVCKRASKFTGTQYLTRSSDASTQIGAGSFSVVVWIAIPGTENRNIVTKWDYNDNRSEWALDYASNRIRFRLKSANYSASQTFTSETGLTVGSWHQVACVYSSTSATAAIYIDGAMSSTAAVAGGTRNDSSRLVVGAGGATSSTVEGYLTGWLADLMLWHRALSADEVAALYGGGAGPTWPLSAPV